MSHFPLKCGLSTVEHSNRPSSLSAQPSRRDRSTCFLPASESFLMAGSSRSPIFRRATVKVLCGSGADSRPGISANDSSRVGPFTSSSTASPRLRCCEKKRPRGLWGLRRSRALVWRFPLEPRRLAETSAPSSLPGLLRLCRNPERADSTILHVRWINEVTFRSSFLIHVSSKPPFWILAYKRHMYVISKFRLLEKRSVFHMGSFG